LPDEVITKLLEMINKIEKLRRERKAQAYLNQKFLPPVVKVVKWFHWINIIYKNTAISPTIESNS